MEKLFILDASGYIYRSYHAIRNITNAKGESTNALFGFIRSITKLRKDFNPQYLISVFDGPRGIEKREQIYAEYKAHRVGMPADLAYQIGWAKQACELMGIPYMAVPGVEADDTMGSIAVWAAKHGATVYLCTSDKDLSQLVNDKILILNTFKENLILGAKEIQENFGVPPELMVDLLAMTGDASDNVPGMPGIGPKTAAALLQEFGSLDKVLQNSAKISGKKQEIVNQYADQALLSRRLVEIHLDVDFPKKQSFFEIKSPDVCALRAFYASMNFNSLIRELEQLPEVSIETKQVQEPVYYALVDEEHSFTELISTLSKAKEVAISVKGNESQPIKSEVFGIAFAVESHKAWYVPLNGQLGSEYVVKGLREIFSCSSTQFFGHNIKYDVHLLQNLNIPLQNISFDTMLASYLLNSHSRQHSLDHLMLELFDKIKVSLSELLGKGKKAKNLSEVPLQQMTTYSCEDVDYIFRIKEKLTQQLKERNLFKLYSGLEMPLLKVLAKMERNGIFLDKPFLEKMSKSVQNNLSLLEQEIYLQAGEQFNINSPKQLSEILFTKMGIKPLKKTATGLSTNADVLDSLAHKYPFARLILEYRTYEKLRSTYVDALPLEVNQKTDRIHCTFNQSIAATGRLSCQEPNLQNIPIRTDIGRAIRGAFRPEKPGWSFLAADYSQIELRLLAHLSGDTHLINAFKRGEDIHASTAAVIFNVPLDRVTKEQRYAAKAVNFGIVYGQQAYGLSQELGIEVKDAAAFIEAYFQNYPKVKDFIEKNKQYTRQTGKAITHFGRERLIPEIHSKNGQIRAAAERLAINTPLQGTAADMIKLAMLQIDEKMLEQHLSGKMILQIHDELVFEIPDEELKSMKELVKTTMENVIKLDVPLVVDIVVGKNWAEC